MHLKMLTWYIKERENQSAQIRAKIDRNVPPPKKKYKIIVVFVSFCTLRLLFSSLILIRILYSNELFEKNKLYQLSENRNRVISINMTP